MSNRNHKFNNEFLATIIMSLAQIRKKKGIKQADLNENIGMTDYLLCKWENGHSRPSVDAINWWLQALDAKVIVVANDNASETGEA